VCRVQTLSNGIVYPGNARNFAAAEHTSNGALLVILHHDGTTINRTTGNPGELHTWHQSIPGAQHVTGDHFPSPP
jgi:hypothetical protein